MKKALEIRNLQKTYKNGVVALKGINLDVMEGDFFALLGPNGAGKSTTIGIITSLVNKTSGSVKVFGYDQETHIEQVKSHIGLVPQEFNFNVFEKVSQILEKQAGFYGIPKKIAGPRIEKYLKILGLWQKRDERGRFLSGGQKRRLMIARALIHEPPLLILDEPTAGVDIELRRLMYDFMLDLNKQGTTIILTTHYLEEAETLCKNIGIIDQGELIEHDSMSSLLSRLHIESFILNLDQNLFEPPILADFTFHLPEPNVLVVDVRKEQDLNSVFTALSKLNIKVLSMRNKANRLEEMFLKMTSKKGAMVD